MPPPKAKTPVDETEEALSKKRVPLTSREPSTNRSSSELTGSAEVAWSVTPSASAMAL